MECCNNRVCLQFLNIVNSIIVNWNPSTSVNNNLSTYEKGGPVGTFFLPSKITTWAHLSRGKYSFRTVHLQSLGTPKQELEEE